MFNFFVEEKFNDFYLIKNSDYNHIKNVLRMNIGEKILVSMNGISSLCEIADFQNDAVIAKIITENYKITELPINIHLFQGLPKSDKMELIIQKCVELGVSEITPVAMSRCVVKLDDKKKENKISRWQAISESAAKQSKRTTIPKINKVLSFKELLNIIKDFDLFLVPYESKDGMKSTVNAISNINKGNNIAILIGPEGGFETDEIICAENNGGKIVSLGKRILRTETAAITAVSMCMLYAEMNLSEENND